MPNSSTNKIRYKCKCSCGNDTIVIGADMVNKKVISCGCKWKSRIKAKGDSHFAWNSNLSDEDRNNKRHIYHYNEWRFSVYKRDNFTCRACGSKKSGNFHAHHILNYHNNPHKRVCIDNGITLCKDCHSNFHHIYGYRENNMEQLKEFLKGKLNGSNLN